MNAQLSVLIFLNLNVFVGRDGTGSFRSVVCARSIGSCVWIVSGELKWMGLNVGESQVHETTGATVSGFIAIDDLLLGVINWCGIILDSSGGRDSSGSGESPAGTALSLVLDWGNFTFLNPVDLNRCSSVANRLVVSVILSWSGTCITFHVLEH